MRMVAVPVTKLDQLGGLLAGLGIKVEVCLGVRGRLLGNGGGGLGLGVWAEGKRSEKGELPEGRVSRHERLISKGIRLHAKVGKLCS